MSKSVRRQRRNLWVQPLAALLVVSIAASSWAAPGDITTIPAPMLGSDPPKARDISDGDASVSTQTGALTYGFPIAVPPGRMGIQPSLSLSYSSQAPIYGGIASGWSLGIPEIRLDVTESVLAMTYFGGLTGQLPPEQREKYITTLSGSRPLVAVTEPAGVAADVLRAYRAANDDSYVRYERLRPGSIGTWRARTPEGLVHTFGESSLSSGGTQFVVPLTSTEDSYGNRIDYRWTSQQISEIRYTSNPSAGLPAFAKMQFDYVDEICPGARLPTGAAEDLRLGTKEGFRKLTKIRVIAHDSAFATQHTREYTLAYDAAAASCLAQHGPLRMLTSIQESAWMAGQNHVDLPPVTFQYGPLERQIEVRHQPAGIPWHSGYFAGSLNAGKRENEASWNGVTTMMLDFDGDSLPDRIELFEDVNQPNECKFTWTKNMGRDSGGSIWFDWSTENVPITMPRLPWANGAKGPDERCYLNFQFTKVITPNGATDCSAPPGGTHLAYRWLDMTSDGLPDLVAAIHHDNHFVPESLANVDGTPWSYASTYFENLRIAAGTWPTCGGGAPDGGACPALSGQCLVNKLSCLPGTPCSVPYGELATCMDQAAATSCGILQRQAGYNDDHCTFDPKCPRYNPLDPGGPGGGAGGTCTRELPHEMCDRFPWIIYRNLGGGALQSGEVKLEPAPLESESGDSPAGGGGAVFSRHHAVIDIDGDGHLDLALRGADFQAPYNSNMWWLVFRGDGAGNFTVSGADEIRTSGWSLTMRPSWAVAVRPVSPVVQSQ